MAGRGRGRPPGSGQLKGATWEHDATIKLEFKPTELYPAHPSLNKPTPMSQKERMQVNYYKELQDKVHRGPLYTQPTKRDPNAPAKTFSEDQFNRQFATNPKADMDPFADGVETYSKRYAPKKNILPKLSDLTFNKEFFPKELWSVFEGEEGTAVRDHLGQLINKRSAMLQPTRNANDPSDKEKILLEKIHKVAGEGDDGEEEEEEVEEEQEVDRAYDDEDMGDDYNAEAYFDDGEANSEGEDARGGGDDY